MTEWTVRLATAAERDFQGILKWTGEQFGQISGSRLRRRDYRSIGSVGLGTGSRPRGTAQRNPAGPVLSHITRGGRKGRHLILFRVDRQRMIIEVLAAASRFDGLRTASAQGPFRRLRSESASKTFLPRLPRAECVGDVPRRGREGAARIDLNRFRSGNCGLGVGRRLSRYPGAAVA